jgi:hypothetical protein
MACGEDEWAEDKDFGGGVDMFEGRCYPVIRRNITRESMASMTRAGLLSW